MVWPADFRNECLKDFVADLVTDELDDFKCEGCQSFHIQTERVGSSTAMQCDVDQTHQAKHESSKVDVLGLRTNAQIRHIAMPQKPFASKTRSRRLKMAKVSLFEIDSLVD